MTAGSNGGHRPPLQSISDLRSSIRPISISLLLATSFLLVSCQSPQADVKPIIEFTKIPPAGPGGPVKVEPIEGRVQGGRPGQRIVLYAKSGQWWVQPFSHEPYTTIKPDSTWSSSTHIGTEYAALLVESSYVPPAKSDSLPMPGKGVVATGTVRGREVSTPPPRPDPIQLHFSGYDWESRAVSISSGGTANTCEPGNVWTDTNGWLHLRVAPAETEWSCAEVTLRRSLGYGSYRFVVQDVSHFEPALVMTICTWDESDADPNHRDIDIEISRWGDPLSKNAQYVVHPYYVPANVVRFNVPAGRMTHLIRWRPGRVSFQTVRGSVINASSIIEENEFTSGVPVPGGELLRLNLYVYGKPRIPMERGAEVVVEKFEYLP